MALKDVIQAGIARIAARQGNPVFTWQGEDYACVAGSGANTLTLGEGGFGPQADLVLYVSKELFTDSIFPKSQQRLTYNGNDYRIVKVNQDPMAATLKLTCVSPERGA